MRKACALLLAITVMGLMPGAAQAQEAGEASDDFGAETIEGGRFHWSDATEALPVEFVEERITPSVEELLKAKKKAAEEKAQSPAGRIDYDEDEEISPDRIAAAGVQKDGPESDQMSRILDVRDADITALIKAISKITRRNFVLDSKVKGKITIHLPTPVSEDEALRIFDSVLLLKGFTTVPLGGDTYKIVSVKDAKQTTIPLVEGDDDRSDTLVTELVRLKHVQAEDMQQLLSQFVGASGGINSFSGTNTLLIIDSGRNIERLRELVRELDVPAVDQDITIIPVLHAEAPDIAEKVKEILGEDDAQQAQSASRASLRRASSRLARRGQTQTQQASAGKSVERRALPLKIIPDERTNSIIVVADPELTAKVRALVERLDSEVDRSGGRFYVYRLQHADAEQLAEILNQLISGAAATDDSNKATTGSSLTRTNAPRTNPAQQTSERRTAAQRIAQAIRDRMRNRQSTSEGKVSFEGEVSIAPDPSTNSLIINAARADYLKLKEVISLLDVKRRQVLVEATLVEVRLTNEEGMGIELQGAVGTDDAGFIGQTNYGGLTNLLTNPSQLSDLTIAAASTGTLTLPGGLVIPSQAVLISALSANSNANVLSSPTILATDNEEAEIIVGENVPFVTSTSTDPSNLNNTFNQIERQDVGITLRITPQISLGDFVLLKIFVEISNVVTGTRNDPNGPTTTIRTTETTVEVKNGQMIITGGLISDNVTESTRGVPFLQDIPVLGNLFQTESLDVRRNNLLVFITPRIISDQYVARDETKTSARNLQKVVRESGQLASLERVLESKAIDNVAAEMPTEMIGAGTITPVKPKAPLGPKEAGALERTQARLSGMLRQQKRSPAKGRKRTKAKAAAGGADEVIDITVAPDLPSIQPQESAEPQAAAAQGAEVPALGTQVTYVVLRDLNEINFAETYDLPYSDELGTVGLIVKGEGPSAFFRTGQRYTYDGTDEQRAMVCLGTFSEAGSAERISSGLAVDANWHELSPRELLSLGEGAWREQ